MRKLVYAGAIWMAMSVGASTATAASFNLDLTDGSAQFVEELNGSGAFGEGNSLVYSNGQITATVNSYSVLENDEQFSISHSTSWAGGLGVCNSVELAEGCSSGPHALDNKYGTDVLVFVFDHIIDFSSVDVGYARNDADLDWIVGTGGLDFSLEGIALLDLDLSLAIANTGHSENSSTRTDSISGTGNILIVAAEFDGRNDQIKISGVGGTALQPIPLPPAVLLFASALIPLLRLR